MKLPGKLLAAAAVAVTLAPLGVRGDDLNLLLVTIDTLRPDRLSCYGSRDLKTPRIDGLASAGALFERAFAHTPITLASHTNILLGLLPPTHGVSENSKSYVPDSLPTLATILKAAGYGTGAFVGAFALDSRWGLTRGFDVYDDHYPRAVVPGVLYPERRAADVIAPAMDWLAKRSGKWFCLVHLWDPHAPYSPPEPYAGRFKEHPYEGEIAYVDEMLGKLLDAVQKQDGGDKTLIVLTADHGESLGDHGEAQHGYFAYNATIWVPLIVVGPGFRAARIRDYVSHVDLLPTLCDILGVDKPHTLAGASLLRLLKGGTRKPLPIYFESLNANLNRGWAPLRGIIRDGKKYIDSPIPEFFDLEKDFDEKVNLAAQTDLQPHKKTMNDLLSRISVPAASQTPQAVSREVREKLRSLGYVTSPVAQVKKSYGPADDLKTLLPLEQKLSEAASLSRAGRAAESVALLEGMVKARSDFAQAYDGLYQVYVSQGLVDEALAALDRGYAANRDNYGVVAGYGLALVKHGKWAKGIEVLGEAISRFPRDAETWDALGLAYSATGDLKKAEDHFKEAVTLDPTDAVYNGHLGSFYLVRALRLKSSADLDLSLAYFDKAIATDPSSAAAYNGRAGAMKTMGRRDQAVADWEKAAALDRNFDLPLYNLAVIYLETGDKTRALEYCQKYLTLKGRRITEQERQEITEIIRQCQEK